MTLADNYGDAWRRGIARLIQEDSPDELATATDLCEALALIRADALERVAVPLDVVLAGSLLCWLPFKPVVVGAKFDWSAFESSALEARRTVLDRRRDRDSLVRANSDWLTVSTDEILRRMAEPGRELPGELFI